MNMTINNGVDKEKTLDAALNCAHCSMCYQALPSLTQANSLSDTCPAGLYFTYEAYYSPGRNQLAASILQDQFSLTDSEKLKEILYSCTTCGACEINCRYINDMNVLPVHLTESIRALLHEKGIKPLASHVKFAESIVAQNNPYGETSERNASLIDKLKKSKNQGKILYFVGCTTSYRLPNIAEATINILEHLKTDFTISKEEICCGSPLIRTGQLDDVERLVNENIKMIQNTDAKSVLFSCAGCYRTVTTDWPRIYGKELPFNTIHITEFLAKKIEKGKLKFKNPLAMKVAYHDPCHLGRHMFPNQVYDEPRLVLDSIPGIERLPLKREKDSTLCCGAGGGVKAGLPEYSEYIASLRVNEARAVGAEVLTTSCPFCMRGLNDGATKEAQDNNENKIPVIALTELVNKAIGGGK
jgi:heterodisulfide reductase subunit D